MHLALEYHRVAIGKDNAFLDSPLVFEKVNPPTMNGNKSGWCAALKKANMKMVVIICKV